MDPPAEAMDPPAEAMEGGEYEYDGGDDEMAAAEGMDGGDMGGMAGMEATVTDPRQASDSSATFEGFANVPACFLRNCLINPVFGDLAKSYVISREFFPDKKNDSPFHAVAGFISSHLVTSDRADAEAWFSGYVGELDAESLRAMKDQPILFPGWSEGWANADDATNNVKHLDANRNSKKDIVKAVFHVTGASVLTACGNRSVAHRLAGKVTAVEEKDGVMTIEVAADPHNDKTIAEWEADKLAAAAAAAKPEEATGMDDKPAENMEAPAENAENPPAENPAE